MTQTQEIPKEKVDQKIGRHGGGDGGHICWRCALKRAVVIGAATAAASFVRDMSKSALKSEIVEASLRTAGVSQKEIGTVTDAIHDIVVYLDKLSGRSVEVN